MASNPKYFIAGVNHTKGKKNGREYDICTACVLTESEPEFHYDTGSRYSAGLEANQFDLDPIAFEWLRHQEFPMWFECEMGTKVQRGKPVGFIATAKIADTPPMPKSDVKRAEKALAAGRAKEQSAA